MGDLRSANIGIGTKIESLKCIYSHSLLNVCLIIDLIYCAQKNLKKNLGWYFAFLKIDIDEHFRIKKVKLLEKHFLKFSPLEKMTKK